MIVWYAWPDCTFIRGSWGGRKVDSFWVECTPEEIKAQILPRIGVKTKKELYAVQQQEQGERGQIDPDIPIHRYPNIFFLIARDLSSIYPMPSVYPFSSMWNAYNPFVEIETREIADLSELGGIAIRPKRPTDSEEEEIVTEMQTYIVTPHGGLVEWLRRQGITGTVVQRITGAQAAGSRIIGTVPLHIAALAAEVVNVKLAKLPYNRDKTDLSADEMEAAGAKLVRYKVTALD